MAKIKLKLWFRKLTVKTSPSSSSTQCHLPFSRSNCGSACVNELQELPCTENGVLQLSNPNGNSTPNPNNTATPNPKNIATVTRNPIIVSSNHHENTVRNPKSLNEAAVRPRSRLHEVNMSTVHCGCSHYYSSRFASSFRKSTQDILASSCKGGRSSDPIPPAIASNDGLQSPTELEGNRGEDRRNRRTRISSNRRTKERVSRRTSDSTSQETDDVLQNKELENGVINACSKTSPHHHSAYYHPCVKGSYNGVDEVHGNCVETLGGSRKSERQQEFLVSIGEDLGGVGDPISSGHMVSPSCKFDSTYGLIMSLDMIDADNGIVDASSADYNDGHANGIKDDDDHANGNNNSNNNNRGEGDYCDTSCFDYDKGIVAMKSGRDGNNGNGNSGGCVAVMKCSNDPVADFHGSMLDVIMAAAEEEEEEEWWRRRRVLLTASDMEALLLCYLSLNSQEHHHAIVTAFTQVWKEVFANDQDLS